jgi:hypothetical protein
MAGDEIVADWLGDVYASVITTTATAQRLNATSLRFRDVHIYNVSSTISGWLGKYLSSNFVDYARLIVPRESISLKFVDLYELGCLSFGAGSCQFRILGINNY